MNCADDAAVMLSTIKGAGHPWFGETSMTTWSPAREQLHRRHIGDVGVLSGASAAKEAASPETGNQLQCMPPNSVDITPVP
ncbi:MAG: hypothetical protein WCL29_01650 [Pseudomonadota bacterium]